MIPAPPPHPEKSSVRRHLRGLRAALPPMQRRLAELRAARQARAMKLLRSGKRIAAYIPVGSEFSPWPLMLLALKLGVAVYLPQVPKRGRRLRFVRFDQHSNWVCGAYGIPEPQHPQYCRPQDLDTVFLPLVGCDSQGMRMGQGGGYYDATFAFRRHRQHWKKPRLVGLAFACQQVETLPSNHWDLRLDTVLGVTDL